MSLSPFIALSPRLMPFIVAVEFEDGGVIVSGDWKSFWTNYGNPDGLAEFECRVVALVEEIKASFPSAQPSTKKQTWIIPAPQGRLDSRTSEESGGVRIQFLVGSLKAIVAAVRPKSSPIARSYSY